MLWIIFIYSFVLLSAVSIVADRKEERRRSSVMGRATLQRALSIEEHWNLTPGQPSSRSGLRNSRGSEINTKAFSFLKIMQFCCGDVSPVTVQTI